MNNTKNYLIIGIVCVAILITGLVTYLIYSNQGESETEIEEISSVNSVQEQETTSTDDEAESASTEMGKTVEESEEEIKENIAKSEETLVENDNLVDTAQSIETSTNTINTTSNTEAESETEENKNAEPEFCAPIKGEIMREFASESLVYSNTLQEWVTHNGIDIKADKTSVVSSAANGTVYAIKNDPRYGLTVIINHDGGYQTVYSNLLTAEFVVEGEKVQMGQTIGTVGNSATFEISDEYHLHFEILKDNNYINPITCINF